MSGDRPASRPSERQATVAIGERRLHTTTWPNTTDDPPSVVFLHDGLGSIRQWRGVPARVAARTGRTVLAYDRAGHGSSTPTPDGPRPADWLDCEAAVLAELLERSGATDATLVGHSDGGSIAAIHAVETASSQPGNRAGAVGPLILLAAHTWTEDVTVDAIVRMRATPAPILAGLARFHDHPVELFEAWSGTWLSPEFSTWDIRNDLAVVERPVVVAQGTDDEYATAFHATSSAAAFGANAEARLLPGLGHLLHHESPAAVVDLIVDTLARHSTSG